MIYKYTYYNDREVVYEGCFREQPSGMFKVGDWFLTHHTCAICNVPIMQQIKELKGAYSINGQTVYDFIVEGGSSYKSNLLHTSLYDQIINKRKSNQKH